MSSDPEKRARQLANLKGPPPPPEKGNQRAKLHGGYASVATERLAEKEREVYDALAADAPVRAADGSLPAADAAAVSLLAKTLCRLEDVGSWLEEYGPVDTRRHHKGRKKATGARAKRKRKSVDPLRVVAMEDRLISRSHELLDALGMTPRSRAKLGLDLARQVDLADAMSDPDPERRAAKLREAGIVEADAEEMDQ